MKNNKVDGFGLGGSYCMELVTLFFAKFIWGPGILKPGSACSEEEENVWFLVE